MPRPPMQIRHAGCVYLVGPHGVTNLTRGWKVTRLKALRTLTTLALKKALQPVPKGL